MLYQEKDQMRAPSCDICGEPMSLTGKFKQYKRGGKSREYYYVKRFECSLCDITHTEWDERDRWYLPAMAAQDVKRENEIQAREPFE